MTSKFFAGTSSSSESGESGSSSGSDEKQVPAAGQRRYNFEDSSSDDTKRVVRSAKAKKSDELAEFVKKIENGIKINDWKQIVEHYSALQIKVDKNGNTWKKIGGIPKSYYRIIVKLDELVTATVEDKAAVKKMNSNNAKSLNKMKQTIRKLVKAREAEIKAFKEAPESSESSSEEAPAEQKEPEAPAPVAAAPEAGSKFLAGGSEESSSEDDNKGPDDWSSESDTKKPAAQAGAAVVAKPKGASFWLKGSSDEEEKTTTKKTRDKSHRKKKEKGPREEKKKEIVVEDTDNILKETHENRGKRGTDANLVLKRLNALLALELTPVKRVEVTLLIISITFDVNPNLFSFLPVADWRKVVADFNALFGMLRAQPNIIVDKSVGEVFKEPEGGIPAGTEVRLSGNLMALAERLDDEYTKSLRHIEPHKEDYLDRLKDEATIVELCTRVQEFLDGWGMPKDAASMAMRRVEHIFYKRPDVATAGAKAAEQAAEAASPNVESLETAAAAKRIDALAEKTLVSKEDTTQLMHQLCVRVYRDGDDRQRTRAMLCHIYHHALYNRFFVARDYLLMSHLQESIQTSRDIPTQIMFNRTMVQLGLCAFRNGLIVEAHNCLSEICSSGRVKELLAQGITNQRFGDRNLEQEKVEKRRLVPYHMHINLEMLECVHLTCAMLLEVPHMAANERETKRRIISKHFRRFFYDRNNAFTGPPENTRDHVIAAARNLAKGEVQACLDILLNISCWKIVSGTDDVKEMVARKVKEEGLRTYLFTYSMYYDSISQDSLAQMFELPPAVVHSIVSKMIITEELHASWDQPTSCIIVHRTEPTRLQFLALQFAEKASAMVENNEKLLDVRSGAYGNKFDKKSWTNEPAGRANYYNKPYTSQYGKRDWNKGSGFNNRGNWDRNQSRRSNRRY